MKSKVQREIREKARLTYGLLNILREDIDRLRTEANDYDLENLSISIGEAVDTLQRLMDVMTGIEYALYLDRIRESQ